MCAHMVLLGETGASRKEDSGPGLPEAALSTGSPGRSCACVPQEVGSLRLLFGAHDVRSGSVTVIALFIDGDSADSVISHRVSRCHPLSTGRRSCKGPRHWGSPENGAAPVWFVVPTSAAKPAHSTRAMNIY